MNENSSSLDLNTLWVEYKNSDGRVSNQLSTKYKVQIVSVFFSPSSSNRFIFIMLKLVKQLGLNPKDNV